MSGIAGVIDLAGKRLVPPPVLHAMADAIWHRGPDEDGYFQQEGVSLASRRLAIVGLFDGRQPLTNEDRTVAVVVNGALFDHPEQRAVLEGKGHRFLTNCDTELLPHLWEEYGENMFDHLRGQFAFALWDSRQQRLILARDRFGICPLYWARRGDWLLFGSEIKAILASSLIPVRPDLRGINHVFTFFAMPGPVTCFEGVSSLLPGHFLDIRRHSDGSRNVRDRTHWEIDFPDKGQEEIGTAAELTDRLERVMLGAVERRLQADVPVVSYLSGGLDSSLVVALANKVAGKPIPTFTIGIDDPQFDERSQAGIVARHIGAKPAVLPVGARDILNAYPRLVTAAESPVIDTACAALLLLAEKVHAAGFKTTLTGEGADEWFGSYPWVRVHKLLSYLDVIPGLSLSQAVRRLFLRLGGAPLFPKEVVRRTLDTIGGPNPWMDIYGLVSLSKLRFFGPEMRQVMEENHPYADLCLNQERLRRWHPFNRALYLGARVHLPGLLLNAKGDRISMRSAVEMRYPFLDDEVFDFLSRLHPSWKQRGLGDKHLLRLLAERYLPREIVWRKKALFRAPFDSFHCDKPPAFVEQLFSPESLCRSGYFDVAAVEHWRKRCREMRPGAQRTSVEMGLAGVLSTQLWHHLYIDDCLADLPGATPERPQKVPA